MSTLILWANAGVAAPAAGTVHKAPLLDTSKLKLASVYAMVFDTNTGEPIYAKNPDKVVPIASITKLMTAMVVLDAKQPLDEMVKIDVDKITTLKGVYSRVRRGSEISRHEMLRLALMSSENRAAACLGQGYPGGLAVFVEAMNKKAKDLGMSSSHFAEPTGLSKENVSTPKDLVKMVSAANKYDLIREFTTTPQKSASFQKPNYTLGFYNTNALVRNNSKNSWDISVSKTGFTNPAGRCLVMLAKVADRTLAIVLLNSNGKLTPVGDATRIKRWIESGMKSFVPVTAKSSQKNKSLRLTTS